MILSVRRFVLIVVALLLTASLIANITINAQGADTGNSGLQISPTRNDLAVQPGESRNFTLTLKNITQQSITAKPFVNDFESDGETGQPKLLVDTQKRSSRSIADFVKGLKEVVLAPGQSSDVQVLIEVPPKTAPGAYYGAIRYAAVPTEQQAVSDRQIALTASVASLVLLEVSGQTNEGYKVDQVSILKDGSAGTFFTGAPDKSAIKITNTGNTFIQPFGKITITRNGKEVYTYSLNDPGQDLRQNVLPDSSRAFVNDIKNTGSVGRYVLTANISYKQGGEVLTVTKTFWVIPLWFIGAVILLMVVIVGGILYWKRRKR